MLRAAVLLSFLRRIQRFSTSGHPEALVACYAASWQLPRLDFHQLADDSFQDTPSRGWAARQRNGTFPFSRDSLSLVEVGLIDPCCVFRGNFDHVETAFVRKTNGGVGQDVSHLDKKL